MGQTFALMPLKKVSSDDLHSPLYFRINSTFGWNLKMEYHSDSFEYWKANALGSVLVQRADLFQFLESLPITNDVRLIYGFWVIL
jgi:hypothetical protein